MKAVVLMLGAVLATGANGEQKRSDLYFACMGAGQVDAARATAICAEFVEVLKDHSGLALLGVQEAPLKTGPGLEILVNKASDTMLELAPTWIDKAGDRTTLQTSAVSAMDINLSERMRRNLYLRILASPPK